METKADPDEVEACGFLRRLSPDENARALAEAREKEIMDRNSEVGSAKRQGKAEGLKEVEVIGEEKGLAKGLAKGLVEGLAEGLKKGEENVRLEIARNLLREKWHLDATASVTKLYLEEVEKLASELSAD